MPVLGGPHLDAMAAMRAAISVDTTIAHPGESATETIVQIPVAPVDSATSITYNNGLYTPTTITPTATPQTSISSTAETSTPATTTALAITSSDTSLSSVDPTSDTPVSFATFIVSSVSTPSSSLSSSATSSSSTPSPSASVLNASQHKWPLAYNLVIAGGCVLLVGAIGLFYTRNLRRKRRKRELAETYLRNHTGDDWTDNSFDEKPVTRPTSGEQGLPGFAGRDDAMTERTYYDDMPVGQIAYSASAVDYAQSGDRGWAWGAQPRARRNATPPGRYQQTTSEDLNAYLAESRTGYTPAEAEQAFKRQPSFTDRLYSTMTSVPQTRQISSGTLEPGQIASGFSQVNSLHVANPDMPQRPSSIQANDAQISRSVKRWQLADEPSNRTAATQTNSAPVTPTRNRYQELVGKDSPYKTPTKKISDEGMQNRLPSSLQAARFQPFTSGGPLTPPTQPALFFSTNSSRSPGCAMPQPTSEPLSQALSLDGIASLVFPGYDGPATQPKDVFTALPRVSRRAAAMSPVSEASNYSADQSTFSSPQNMSSPPNMAIRKAIAERRRGAYEKVQPATFVRSESQESLEQLLRTVR